jgi:tetratricopeptide (TPR) repeat protein
LLEHRGDYAGALQAYEAALAVDPASGYICAQAANVAIETGEAEKAVKLARRLLEIDPQSAKSHLILGRALWAHDDAAGAQVAFEEALKLDPKSTETILALGSLLGERAPDKARDILNRFIAENPDDAVEAHYQLAKIDFDAGLVGSAIGHLKAGLNLEPDSLPLHYALAQAYETQGSTDAALAEYRNIVQLEPSNVALVDRIGELHFAKGELDEARASFLQAHRLQPSDPLSSQWLASDAERQGEWGKAADYIKTSAALADDHALNLRLSYCYTQAGQLAEAVRTLEAAHERWPTDDQVAYYLALGYDDLKASEKSVKLLRQVLELKPAWRDARYQLAIILEKLNRLDEAEPEFRRLLVEKPDDDSALNYLGYSLADRGIKLEEAERLIREALRLSPAEPAYLDSLGWVLFKEGRPAEAVPELERASSRGPEDATVWDHLGDAYAAAGSTGSAWVAWRRAEALADTPLAAARKAVRIQGRFGPAELGELYMRHLAAAHGRLAKLSAVCRIEGMVLNHRFSYDGMLSFKGPQDLSLDLLGPLFVPLFRMRMGADGFTMDAIRIEGVDPALIRGAVEGMLAALREYFSGDLFALRPASYRKGWWGKGWLETAGRRLDLDAQGVRLAALAPPEGSGRVLLADFVKSEGRLVPTRFSVVGPGYSLSIKLGQVKTEFLPDPGFGK